MSVEDSSESTSSSGVTPSECADWRDRARGDDTAREIAAEARFHYSTVIKHIRGRESCPHDHIEGHPEIVPPRGGGPGVHAVTDDSVTDRVYATVRDRIDANYGTTVNFSAGQLVDDHNLDLAGQRVSAALRELTDSDRAIDIKRINPDANQARWVATDPAEGGSERIVTDGGTTDDEDTVAWCPGCKRFVAAENEASHVRRKHLRSYPGEIQSRYRRVSRAHIPVSSLNAPGDGEREHDGSDYRINEVLE